MDDIHDALYASKVISYAQGFELMSRGREEYDWDLRLGSIADDLARRLHHPRPLPEPHHRRLRRQRRTS